MQTTHLGTVVLPPPCQVFKFLFRVIGKNSGRNPRAWPSLCASGLWFSDDGGPAPHSRARPNTFFL